LIYLESSVLPVTLARLKEEDSNLLFDSNIQRRLFDEPFRYDLWDALAASILSYEPSFNEIAHRVISSTAPFLESMGLSLKEVRSRLENFIKEHKKLLISYRSCHGKEASILDALFFICRNFYDQNQMQDLTESEQRMNGQKQKMQMVHSRSDDLSIELAFEAMSHFEDFCLLEESDLNQDKLSIAMIKCWMGWISQNTNVSAYRFISQILKHSKGHKEIEEGIWTHALDLVDDSNDDLVHFCVFGAFIAPEEKKASQQPVKVFIPTEKANQFILKVLYYKIMLKLIENTLNLRIPLQTGLIYIVEADDMKIVNCIRVEDLTKMQDAYKFACC
jgi:hypothetical protein